MSERERKKERKGEREGEKEREKATESSIYLSKVIIQAAHTRWALVLLFVAVLYHNPFFHTIHVQGFFLSVRLNLHLTPPSHLTKRWHGHD